MLPSCFTSSSSTAQLLGMSVLQLSLICDSDSTQAWEKGAATLHSGATAQGLCSLCSCYQKILYCFHVDNLELLWFISSFVYLYLKASLRMFMNTNSIYRNLFHCFCLIFTTMFQIFLVPEITTPQNFLVGEPWQRGISSAWCDTQSHRTPMLSGTCAFQQPRAEAAWGLPCSSPWHWKIPELPMLLSCPGTSCEVLHVPGVPSCKKILQSAYKLFKSFWELLLKSWVLRAESCSASFHLLSVLENN